MDLHLKFGVKMFNLLVHVRPVNLPYSNYFFYKNKNHPSIFETHLLLHSGCQGAAGGLRQGNTLDKWPIHHSTT